MTASAAAPHPLRLARQPALSAAQPDRAVLGRQRHRRPFCGRAYSARHAVVPALERRVPDHPAVRLEPSCPRLGRNPPTARHDDPALRHRHRRLQHPAILGARAHPGAQHPAAAIGGAAVRRDLVAGSARHPADAGAGLRHHGLAVRRAGDPAARRPHHVEEHRIQQGRRHLHRGAGDLRAVFGTDAEASQHPRPVVRRFHLRRGCRVPDSVVYLGTGRRVR